MKKKPSREELKDILLKEEIDARWKKVENSKRIKAREERKAYWKKANAPFNQPNVTISDEVRKTRQEYEDNNPILQEMDIIGAIGSIWIANMGLIYCLIGIYLFIQIVTAGYEESCLSC